jgi:hypothetical protein
MKNVINLLLVLCSSVFAFSQGKITQKKREQKKLEKKISKNKKINDGAFFLESFKNSNYYYTF